MKLNAFLKKARTAQLLARKNIPLGARGFYITGVGCKAGYSGDPLPHRVPESWKTQPIYRAAGAG
jgi:hypothetical protein